MSGTDLVLPGSLSETGLELPTDLSFEDWQRAGETFGRIERACQWWIGDWLNYGERAYGEKYTEALEATGLAYVTLAKCKQASKAIEIDRRRSNLSWSHHDEVKALPPAEQDRWLDVAEGNGDGEPLSRAKFREALRGEVREPPPTTYFGKGDKWKESTDPLSRYLAAWEKRGYEFGHLNPREAASRVKRIDALIEGLIAARADLEPRSHKATLTFTGRNS